MPAELALSTPQIALGTHHRQHWLIVSVVVLEPLQIDDELVFLLRARQGNQACPWEGNWERLGGEVRRKGEMRGEMRGEDEKV